MGEGKIMEYGKADLFKRIIASLIDGVIASVLIYTTRWNRKYYLYVNKGYHCL